MNYKLSEIAAVCGGSLTGSDTAVSRVITDSRSFPYSAKITDTADKADGEILFTAIRTTNRDGAAFVGELYDRGVRAFLVGEGFADAALYPEAGFVAVPDTVAALQALAAHRRKSFKGKVIGITGSYGKTTVKEWIAQLAPAGVTLFRSPKSWNSQIGVPLSVLMAKGDEDYIVIEAGISEPGEMAVLQRIICPDAGILTSVGGAHEQNFGPSTAESGEKAETDGDTTPDIAKKGVNMANSASRMQLLAEKMTLFDSCDVLFADENSDFVLRNANLAADFWRREGYTISDDAIAALQPVAMRLEVKEGLHNSIIINDTYNSDTASLAIALDHLGRVAGARPRIVIMPSENPEAARLVRSSGVERLIEIGPEFTVDDALRSLTSADIEGRAILIKGGARSGFDRISRALERHSHTTVMEIDLDAMRRNLRRCRSRLSSGVGIMPMIKASAYGHGTFEVARTLEGEGVDYLAVAFADEGVELREAGIAMPIVVLNADAGSFESMIRHRLEPEIYNFDSLGEFTALLKRHGEVLYPVHIKLDTGMHRLGFREDDIPGLISEIAAAERYIHVATVFSHLAAADDPAQDEFTRRQIADFDRLSSSLSAALPYRVRRHIANTKGAERFPEAQFDMVRLGIGLYGFGMEGAEPVAKLRTRIVHIASLDAGETVGYGRRGVLARPSRIATIPIGYADGLDRRLSGGVWSVLVADGEGNGSLHPAPIVGNVCMDSCMIDITDIPGRNDSSAETRMSAADRRGKVERDNADGESSDVPKVGDEVFVFSTRPGNTVEDMAAALGTIPYEVMTGVSARVKRIYTKE